MKRFTSIILTLVLILGIVGLVPVRSNAADPETYDIWLFGEQLDSSHLFSIASWLDNRNVASCSGTAEFYPGTSENGYKNTLILHNFRASAMTKYGNYGIKTTLGNLVIEVHGKCELRGSHENPFAGAGLYLSGTGTQKIYIQGDEYANFTSLTLSGLKYGVTGGELAEVSVSNTTLALEGDAAASDVPITTAADTICFGGETKADALANGLTDKASALACKYANIGTFDITDMSLNFPNKSVVYNHTQNIPAFTLEGKNVELPGHGAVIYKGNCIDAGHNIISILGQGNYYGITSTAGYTINEGSFDADAAATAFTYNGKAKAPAIIVKDGNRTLSEGIEYELSGTTNATAPGTYVVTVEGIGNYKGSADITYQINPKQASVKSATPGKRKLTVKAAAAPSTCGFSKYQIGYKLKTSKTWKYTTTTTQSKTISSLKKGKVYQVKIRAYKNSSTYGPWSKTVTAKKIK